MATSTYYPNSANCTCWKGNETLNTDDLEYTLTERNIVSVDDNNYVAYYPGMGHMTRHKGIFKIIESEGSVTRIDVTCKGGLGIPPTKFLYIYNDDTSSWELMDSESGDDPVTLTGAITLNCDKYINASGQVIIKLTEDTGGIYLNNYYMQVVITYTEIGGRSQVYIIA